MSEDQVPPHSRSSAAGCALQACGTVAAVLMMSCLGLFWFYGTDSHHESRGSVWPERGRQLIPPTATDITLQRDLLDHRATYLVTEEDLNAFLNRRFSRGEALDSYAEREAVVSEMFERDYGFLGWTWHEGIVRYSYAASNGGVSSYVHDPSTGLTYQTSAYW
jgi:hypothetical protein